MSIDEDIAILEQVPMLRVLGRGALRMIAMGAETREVQPGEILFRPGDRFDCAYVVQEGTFRLSVDPALSGRAIEVGPGSMLGEFALLAEHPEPLSATALDYGLVIRISRSMFSKLLQDDGQAALRLRDYVAHRSQQSLSELLQVRDLLKPDRRDR